MTLPRRILFAALALATLSAPLHAATAGAEAPLVVELFTSQGCSSCPPADAYLAELADRPGVIALSLAVDYWDYLGWKDTLARPANTARQRAYAEARGDTQLFTPQVIVNGQDSSPGQDRAAVERALRTARAQVRAAGPVRVAAQAKGGRIEVSIAAAGGTESSGEVWALGVQRVARVDIGRGENAGRAASYRNVVRSMTRVASWSGRPLAVTLDAAPWSNDGCDAVVVLVQGMPAGRLGAVIGAAAAALK